jgi:hypothetical protein
VIRKSIDRIASIITLLGALATGHSAFADTVNFSGGQVGAGLLSIGQNGAEAARDRSRSRPYRRGEIG